MLHKEIERWDGDTTSFVLLTDEQLKEVEAVDHYQDMVLRDINTRLKSGELDNSTPISLPDEFRERIIKIFEERKQKLETERLVWFTYRVDQWNRPWVDWPLVSYMPFDLIGISRKPNVKKALQRIISRGNIRGIRVVGRLPQHHYFGTSQ